MKFLLVFIFSVHLWHLGFLFLVEERLEEMKSNQTFMQIWREHIKFWREEIESESSQDFGNTFDCPTMNHTLKPNSVHELTPGDIEIVGAMGASIVAGMGAAADSLFTLLLEYRGLSFAIGGDGDLSQMVTIPNILKQFNPNVFGESYRVAPVWYDKFSQLNVAVSGEKSEDLKAQAKQLVQRIKDIPMSDDKWKLITINLGINDICQYCEHNKRSNPEKWVKEYKKALDYLYSHLTHTFINVVSIRSSLMLKMFQEGYPVCESFYKVECPCLNHEQIEHYEREFNKLLSGLVEEYNRHDFTVEFQQFSENIESDSDNKTSNSDLSFMAPDCFHFSQKGHASAARALWNNMMESQSNETQEWNVESDELKCPDSTCPFLRTRKNSIHCAYNAPDDEKESSEEEEDFSDTTDYDDIAVTEDYSEEYSNENMNETYVRSGRSPHTRKHHSRRTRATREPHSRKTRPTREHHHRKTHPTRESHSKETRSTKEPHSKQTHATRESHSRETRPTREPHSNSTRPTREHHHHKTDSVQNLTKVPSGLETTTDNRRRYALEPKQNNNVLPWLVAGILGTLVFALLVLLVAQNYMHKRNKRVKPLSEMSPLLPGSNDEQIY